MASRVNLAKTILTAAFPNAEFTSGKVDKLNAFEIYVIDANGKETLVHSKLNGDGYLDNNSATSVIKKIQEVI